MPNIVVTSDADSVTVVFNDTIPGMVKGIYNLNSIDEVELKDGSSFVVVSHRGGSNWNLDVDGVRGAIVDSVDGVTPNDNGHLCDLIGALIKA